MTPAQREVEKKAARERMAARRASGGERAYEMTRYHSDPAYRNLKLARTLVSKKRARRSARK